MVRPLGVVWRELDELRGLRQLDRARRGVDGTGSGFDSTGSGSNGTWGCVDGTARRLDSAAFARGPATADVLRECGA